MVKTSKVRDLIARDSVGEEAARVSEERLILPVYSSLTYSVEAVRVAAAFS